MSEFETTGLNGSQFEPNFNNLALLESKILSMSDFESIFLTPVGIWLKNLTMHHILMGNFSLKIENTRKMSSLKTNFLGHLTLWKQQNWHFRAFSQILFMKIFCGERYIILTKFLELLHILNHVFENMWDFGKRCLNMSFFEQTFQNLWKQ